MVFRRLKQLLRRLSGVLVGLALFVFVIVWQDPTRKTPPKHDMEKDGSLERLLDKSNKWIKSLNDSGQLQYKGRCGTSLFVFQV